MKIITKKKLKEECWNLDYELVKWLNEHLKIYLEDAGKVVDLDFYKFNYDSTTYTLKDVIERLIDITDYLIDHYYDWDNLESLINNVDEMYYLMRLIHHYLWW